MTSAKGSGAGCRSAPVLVEQRSMTSALMLSLPLRRSAIYGMTRGSVCAGLCIDTWQCVQGYALTRGSVYGAMH